MNLKDSAFTSYEQLEQWFSRARNPALGRPAFQWCRVYRNDEDEFQFVIHDRWNKRDKLIKPFATVTPENVVRFGLDDGSMGYGSYTVTGHFYKALPFIVGRVAKNRFRVVHLNNVPPKVGYYQAHKFGHDLFDGLKLCLRTGFALNPQDVDPSDADPEKRREWLRKLRAFKRAMRTRTKLGVYDTLDFTEEYRNGPTYYRNWTTDEAVQKLAQLMDDPSNIPRDMLAQFFLTGTRNYWRRSDGSSVSCRIMQGVEDACTEASFALRKHYGVFDNE